MNIILFDPEERQYYYPLAFTRPVGDIRFGIFKIIDKWQKVFPHAEISYLTEPYLQGKFPVKYAQENFYLSAHILPEEDMVHALGNLKANDALQHEGETFALKSIQHFPIGDLYKFIRKENYEIVEYHNTPATFKRVWDLFNRAGKAIQHDLKHVAHLKASKEQISALTERGVNIIGNDLYLDERVTLWPSIINTTTGPVVLQNDSEIMEGAIIRGPFVLGEHAVVKMGAKIYGPTCIGPYCKVGGEITNCSFQAYSNKGHDGFTGNSVFGEWVNLGADTNTSNLKNNYSLVKVWDFEAETFTDTGMQFCGTIMGDHSKTGINTMLNTGTMVGVFANIFDAGFPPKFVPSFYWGSNAKAELYDLQKAKETARIMMERRGVPLSKEDERILEHLYARSKNKRLV